MPDGTLDPLCFSRPFYTEGQQLVDDPDSWIRNGRIANLEKGVMAGYFLAVLAMASQGVPLSRCFCFE